MKTIHLHQNKAQSFTLTLFDPSLSHKKVIMIVHGAGEHINRYTAFIARLNNAGITVLMHEHAGHSALSPSPSIHIGKDEKNSLVERTQAVYNYMKAHYPTYEHYIFAHSLGAFSVRALMHKTSLQLDGIFLTGSSVLPKASLNLVALLTSILSHVFREDKVLKPWLKLTQDQAYRKLKKSHGINRRIEWLTKDAAMHAVLRADPQSKKLLTLSAQNAMYQTIKRAHQKPLPTEAPLYLYCGDEDPLCDYGKGLFKLQAHLEKAQISHVHVNVIEGSRHELLNCTGRVAFTEEIIKIIKKPRIA